MNGTPFKLATFAARGGDPFPAIVVGDDAFELATAYAAYRAALGKDALSSTAGVQELLGDWERNFSVMQEIVALLEKEGRPAALKYAGLRALPPVTRPGKMFYAAQNFQEHVDEMIRAGTPASGPQFTGDKTTTHPYLFLKASSCLVGANDEIEIPFGMKRIDWEAEMALAISKPGKRIKAERALEHVAGFMTTNDVSCRDMLSRPDRPRLRADWLGGKSHDKFAPMGPFLVPRAFVADHMNLSIRLTVNGEIRQNGNTSQFIFTPEEQIEFVSSILTLDSGDVFSCGTCGGVGQGAQTFLKAGDVMKTEIGGLGRMRNQLVAERG
jgi:2,4-didehydro-3-deoxy-L-rhamnonate hydrolase